MMEYIGLEKNWLEMKSCTEKTYSRKDLDRLSKLIKNSHQIRNGEDYESVLSRMNDEMLDIKNSRYIKLNKQEILDEIKNHLEKNFKGCNVVFNKVEKIDFDMDVSPFDYDFEDFYEYVNEKFNITKRWQNIVVKEGSDKVQIFNSKSNDIVINYGFLSYSGFYNNDGTIHEKSHIEYEVTNNHCMYIDKYDFGMDGEEKRYIHFLNKKLNYWDLIKEIKQLIRHKRIEEVIS